MTPLRLVLQAFGPFAHRQVIDYTALGAKTFFLIHGPTGAGKTSLLDGKCFALYGDASGNERELRQMRSDHADADTLTEVVFDFALGERRYRVRRSPEQSRKARRGGGQTVQPAAAQLWEIEGPPQAEQLKPIAEGPNKVSTRVVQLLGFNSSQFRQVIMLPQGKFFEFLKSSSKDREDILQTLFGTQIYKSIEEALKRSADQLHNEGRETRARAQALLEQRGCADLGALNTLHAAHRAALEGCQARTLTAAGEADRAERALALARQHAGWFKECDGAAVERTRLQDEQPEWDRRVERLDLAKKAALLQPALAACEEAHEHATQAAAHNLRCKAALDEAQHRRDAAARALSEAEASQPRVDALGEHIAALDGLSAKVGALDAARREHGLAATDAARAAVRLANAKVAAAASAKTAAGLTEEVERLRLDAIRLEGLRDRHAHLRSQHDAASALERTHEAIARVETLVESSQAADQAAARAVDVALERRDGARRAWIAGQAARLARELQQSAACPVCGSLDHPQPARDDAHAVDDEALEDAERHLADAQSTALEARSRAVGDAARLKSLRETASAQQALVSGPSTHQAARQQALQQCAADLASAQRSSDALAQTQERFAMAQAEVGESARAHEIARAQAEELNNRLAQLQGQLSERESGVPPDLASSAALAKARRLAVDERAALDKARQDAQQGLTNAQAHLARAEAHAQNGERALAQHQQIAQQRQQQLDRLLGESGFADLEALAAARVDDAEIKQIDRAVQQHQAQLAAAIERDERARAQVDGLRRPDLAVFEQAQVAAKQAHLDALAQEHAAIADEKSSGDLSKEVRRLTEQFEGVDERHRLLRHVSDICCGNNAMRISLQRYVLATLLEQVLAAATIRLRAMSSGRFEIRRKEQPADQRATAGLDLEVFDQHTSTSRPVSTLSGGESFLASLALALGLSDVVQAYAGGVRMDAIFIDEGFGTLDSEALDKAIRTLKDLQHAGRMVGIISHVSELRDCIDSRLELKVGPKGSHAEFVV